MNKYVSRGMWFTLCVGGLWLAGTAAANAADNTGTDGVATGDQAVVGVSIPVSLSGNGDLGPRRLVEHRLHCGGSGGSRGTVGLHSPDSVSGVLSGDQAVVDVSVPVQVAGNAVSVVGDAGQLRLRRVRSGGRLRNRLQCHLVRRGRASLPAFRRRWRWMCR